MKAPPPQFGLEEEPFVTLWPQPLELRLLMVLNLQISSQQSSAGQEA